MADIRGSIVLICLMVRDVTIKGKGNLQAKFHKKKVVFLMFLYGSPSEIVNFQNKSSQLLNSFVR